MEHPVHISEIHNKKYITIKRLGGGGFCEVVMVVDKNTGQEFALKILDRTKPIFIKGQETIVENKLRNCMRKEANIMRQLDHPNIVKFFDMFEDEFDCYIILEVVHNGELYDWIIEREKIEENDSIGIIKQLVNAVDYLHKKGYVHRDVKPENVLMEGVIGSVRIKLTDLGLAREANCKMFTNCGTVAYCAPEWLLNRTEKKGYGKEVDVWSIGVVTYVTLGGYQPFIPEIANEEELISEIIHCRFQFHIQYWQTISALAKKFIVSILKVNPTERATLENLLVHPWLLGEKDNLTITDH